MKTFAILGDPLQHLHGPPRGHDPLVKDHCFKDFELELLKTGIDKKNQNPIGIVKIQTILY